MQQILQLVGSMHPHLAGRAAVDLEAALSQQRCQVVHCRRLSALKGV
jgi:hypothetical protein